MIEIEQLVEGSRWRCLKRKHRGLIVKVRNVTPYNVRVEHVGARQPRQHRDKLISLDIGCFLREYQLLRPSRRAK